MKSRYLNFWMANLTGGLIASLMLQDPLPLLITAISAWTVVRAVGRQLG